MLSQFRLAWAQLSHQKMRLLVALMGVCFANILMFTQLGLLAVLFDGVTLIHDRLQGDLFLISSFSPFLGRRPFPHIYLYQAASLDGVATASPLYISEAEWVDPQKLQAPQAGKPKSLFPDAVRILAFNPQQPVLNIPEVNAQLEKLSVPDSVLFDRLSQPSLGAIPHLLAQQSELTTVMGNRKVYVVGLFNLGSTLFDKGNVIMSDWNYGRRSGEKTLQKVSVGILQLRPNADLSSLQKQIQATLPSSIKVMTRTELIKQEQDFRAQDPAGTILGFGAVMGFIVGVVVVYQVLYTDVSDHLPEYATLKAMGYSDRSLITVVLQEAGLLAILGFIPGCGTSVGVYQLLTHLTKIPITLRPEVALQVLGLTVVMCGVSGAIALRKLQKADPADIF